MVFELLEGKFMGIDKSQVADEYATRIYDEWRSAAGACMQITSMIRDAWLEGYLQGARDKFVEMSTTTSETKRPEEPLSRP